MQRTIALLLLLASFPAIAQSNASIEQLLRLKPGNYWIYKGTVKWGSFNGAIYHYYGAKAGQITEPKGEGSRTITWKTEVLEKWIHGPITAFIVRGASADLNDYYPDQDEPDLHVWVVYAGRYYVFGADPDFLKHIRTPGFSLVEDINKQTPWLRFPLQENECPKSVNGEAGHPELFDVAKCPTLSHSQRQTVTMPGVDQSRAEIWESKSVDHEGKDITRLALGVGTIQYDNEDRTTNHEVHVKLVEAHLQ